MKTGRVRAMRVCGGRGTLEPHPLFLPRVPRITIAIPMVVTSIPSSAVAATAILTETVRSPPPRRVSLRRGVRGAF
jgi:hypothetical protein